MRWIKKWEVPSESNKNVMYVVALSDKGTFGCSCPVWKFRRQECKHIESIKDTIKSGKGDYGRTIYKKNWIFVPANIKKPCIAERRLDREKGIENIIVHFPLFHLTDCPYTQEDGTSAYDGFEHNRKIIEQMLAIGVPKSAIKRELLK